MRLACVLTCFWLSIDAVQPSLLPSSQGIARRLPLSLPSLVLFWTRLAGFPVDSNFDERCFWRGKMKSNGLVESNYTNQYRQCKRKSGERERNWWRKHSSWLVFMRVYSGGVYNTERAWKFRCREACDENECADDVCVCVCDVLLFFLFLKKAWKCLFIPYRVLWVMIINAVMLWRAVVFVPVGVLRTLLRQNIIII